MWFGETAFHSENVLYEFPFSGENLRLRVETSIRPKRPFSGLPSKKRISIPFTQTSPALLCRMNQIYSRRNYGGNMLKENTGWNKESMRLATGPAKGGTHPFLIPNSQLYFLPLHLLFLRRAPVQSDREPDNWKSHPFFLPSPAWF